MDTNILNILKQIKADRGDKIFFNRSLFNALLKDYAKGQYKGEIRLLITALDEGIYRDLLDNPENYLQIKVRYMMRLKTEYYWIDEHASFAIEVWAAIAGIIEVVSNSHLTGKPQVGYRSDEIAQDTDMNDKAKQLTLQNNMIAAYQRYLIDSTTKGHPEEAGRRLIAELRRLEEEKKEGRKELVVEEIMSNIIGVDLGTTNSCVAVMVEGEVIVIPNAEGNRTTPSIVAFSKVGERIVGEVAKRQVVSNPDKTVISIKQQMGSDYKVKIDNESYSPEEISAIILQKLKTDAEAYLGQTVKQAVISVPVYFTDAQRQATKDAGTIAGLDVLHIINEPSAAALAYSLDKEEDQTVVVYDLGGGKFDVSILELSQGKVTVKATGGNNCLGGDDFDQRLIDYIVVEFKRRHGVDLTQDHVTLQRIKVAAEKAKIELSIVSTSNISIPFITMTDDGPLHLEMDISRNKFEELIGDLVEVTAAHTQQAMQDANLSWNDILQVILVGGSTRIPVVQETVRKLSGKAPHKGVNADEVVAMGAAIQAGVLSGEMKDLVLVDVTPLSLGIETLGGEFTRIIDRNTIIPTTKYHIFSTKADNQTTVDIHVLQGEREVAASNKTLGRFQLISIPLAPCGVPQIEVKFDLDANGIVHVSAKDMATGNEQKVTNTASTSLSKDEVERMRRDAEAHAKEDHLRKKIVDAKNHADSLAYQTEKALKDLEGKWDAGGVSTIKEALEELKRAATGWIKSKSKSSWKQ